MKQKALNFFKENETKLNIAFFVGGFIFDIFTLDEIDSLFAIGQQIVYLFVVGFLLYWELIFDNTSKNPWPRIKKVWEYKDFITHFFIGSLLSIYSIFFIKSSSPISSFVFLIFMLSILVLNELELVQKNKAGLKVGLYLICLFSFFSMIWPIIFGFVGPVPFYFAIVSTTFFIWVFYKIASKKVTEAKIMRATFSYPTIIVVLVFSLFYYMGWIPPVPLSVKEIGIYHNIQKVGSKYQLYYERPKWKFWLRGDQNFIAKPNDRVFVFARIFSPARFSDKVILHWQIHNPKKGWLTTDKISMQIYGGRKEGFRGYTYKANYQAGDWRILVETLDQREIGRINFTLATTDSEEIKKTNMITR